jgi:hypothetical protein
VTLATEIAQQTSAELLAAAEKQSEEIQDAGRSALDMAKSMSAVSGTRTSLHRLRASRWLLPRKAPSPCRTRSRV